MARLTEAQARERLVAEGAEIAASDDYEAYREVGGWSFYRRHEAPDGLFGELPYVVADNGKVAPKPINLSENEIIAELERA
jgi:hypothetical protein